MKKSILSIVLCVAVLMATVSAMLVLPASASDVTAAPYVTYTVSTLTHTGTIPAGTELTFQLSMSATEDVNGIQVMIAFDDELLKLATDEDGYVYSYEGLLANVTETPDNNVSALVSFNGDREAENGVKTMYLSFMSLSPLKVAKDEVILTFTLEAKQDISSDVAISLPSVEVCSDASTIGDYTLVAAGVAGGIAIVDKEKGDVNGDGKVNLTDAMLAFNHVNDKITLDEDAQARADVIAPYGNLTLADAMRIFNYVNDKIDAL